MGDPVLSCFPPIPINLLLHFEFELASPDSSVIFGLGGLNFLSVLALTEVTPLSDRLYMYNGNR